MKAHRILLYVIVVILLLFAVEAAQSADGRTVRPKNKPKAETTATVETGGQYYALIIGNNNYQNVPKLKTARNDAVKLEKILKDKYGFNTSLLLDATRTQIITEINKLKNTLKTEDSFLLYYAGHGVLDKSSDRAYWLPVDADEENPANWIIADDITAYLKRITSKHILIVSDSCYSGSFSRDSGANLSSKTDKQKYISRMAEKQSRTLMASGGNEPVMDEGGGNHSVFAAAFIKGLAQADTNVFTADDLFKEHVRNRGIGKADQTPEYKGIKNSGDDGGDFIFLAKGSVIVEEPVIQEEPATPQPEETTTGRLTIKTTAAGAQVYIDGNQAGTAPVTKTLSPGNYNIELRKEGYKAATETVRVEKGKEKTVSILMEKNTGSIRVTSNPAGGKVYIDGAYTDTAPNTITDLKAGVILVNIFQLKHRDKMTQDSGYNKVVAGIN